MPVTPASQGAGCSATAPDPETPASSTVATDAVFDTGPLHPSGCSVSAVPVEQGGGLNLGLIYSGDVTLGCEDTGSASLVEFLSSDDPVAEDHPGV